MQVGSISVVLGLLMDQASWGKGAKQIDHFRRLALVVGGLFAGRALGGALLGFNQNVENAKNQVASMLALGSGSTMESQLINASNLYDELRKKAATLPGQTEDYINMLGLLAQPLSRAKVELSAMADITSGSFVMAKAMGISWQEASRDLRDFINQGKVTARDKFLLGMLQGSGVDTNNIEKARAQSKKLGVEGRAKLIAKQTTGPLAQEMATRLGSSFEGRLDTVKESIKQTMGKIGQGLFESLKVTMDKVATWFTANQDAIQAWATNVGSYVAMAFEGLQAGILWLGDHQSVLEAFLTTIAALFTIMAVRALGAWLAIAWPMLAGAGLFYMFGRMINFMGALPTLAIAAGAAGALMWFGLLGPVGVMVIMLAAVIAMLLYLKDLGPRAVESLDSTVEKWKKLHDINTEAPGATSGAPSTTAEPTRTLSPFEAAAQQASQNAAANNGVTINPGQTNVNIYTKDSASAKEAFKDTQQGIADAYARAAYKHTGGRPK